MQAAVADQGRDGGATSLENLVLLCHRHHRLVHEGGYTVEDDGGGSIRFCNRFGVIWTLAPPRPPPARADELIVGNHVHGRQIDPDTNRVNGWGSFDLAYVVGAISSAVG